jgi:hypothetical protein
MLSLLAIVTTLVLAVIALGIRDFGRLPVTARTTALSSSARQSSGRHAVRPAASGKPGQHASSPPATAVSGPRVSDSATGLSYGLLSAPWQGGCPGTLASPIFTWSAGENAVAGHVLIGASIFDWHGLACSGLLQEQQFPYSGPGDLEPTATAVAQAVDTPYYGGLAHSQTTEDSSALTVSGHQAWEVQFLISYDPDDASQGVTWSTELGAVVVVDRGAGQTPALFYVSVPANLGTGAVSTLVGSLRLGL